ncbi:MAG: ATP-binding protein [Thermodesulfobacteriota bacterium]
MAASPTSPVSQAPGSRHPRRLAGRLLRQILLASLALTSALSAVHVAMDIRAGIRRVQEHLEEIRLVHAPAMSTSLWLSNRQLLQAQMEGLLASPHLRYLELTGDSDAAVLAVGSRPAGRVLRREYPLSYPYRDHVVPLGRLVVEADLEEVVHLSLTRALEIAASNGVLVLCVATLVFVLHHRLVGRHLEELAGQARQTGVASLSRPLTLRRPGAPSEPDELDALLEAVNAMRQETSAEILRRTAVQGALAASQECLLTVLNSLEALVYVADMQDHRLLFANRYLQARFGEPAGRRCWEVLQAGQSGPCPFCTNDRLLDSEGRPAGVLRWEVRNSVNGRWYDAQDRVIPWLDGRLVRLEIAYDITERKEAEAALQRSHAELEVMVQERTEALETTCRQLLHAEKLAAVGRLAASFAHEFNNPLQGVMGVIRGIQRRAVLEPEDAELVAMALKECERMRKLVQDVQDFHRPSSGRLALVSLPPLLEGLLGLYRADLKRHGIQVACDVPADLPAVPAVADQLQQVFLNLLNNAVDACEGNGRIAIRAETRGAFVAVTFTDNGRGIRSEDQHRIFEPFFSTKPAVKGTGLGLSVSYGIIQRHGGRIEVESTPGQGATFTVLLPREGRMSNIEQGISNLEGTGS